MFAETSISPSDIDHYQNIAELQPFIEDLDSLFGFMRDFDGTSTENG